MVDARTSTGSSRARSIGAPPTSAGSSAIPTSSTGRCCTAAPSILYEGKPVGTPDAGAFWRVIAEHGAVALFTAPDRLPRHQEGGPGRQAACGGYDLSKFRTLFLAGERADPDTVQWAEAHARRADHRPLVADRDRLGDRRQPARPRAAAGEVRLADGADAGLRPPRARRGRQAGAGEHHGHDRRSSCPCRRAASRRCGRPTTASATAISPPSRATTTPRTPASSTRTATSTSWGAPTTSSTSPATASRPAAWRRSWPRTRRSPNAP